MTDLSTTVDALDAMGDRLARRVATVLVDHRRAHRLRLRALAEQSNGRFTVRELRRFERARVLMTPALAAEITDLYGVELRDQFGPREPLDIRPFGVITASGNARSFTPGDGGSLLTAYVELVRACRSDHTTRLLELRRGDIAVLAEHLRIPGDLVVDRLGSLMGASPAQRRIMGAMFLSGEMVISMDAATHAMKAAATADVTLDPPVHANPGILARVPDGHSSAWSSVAMDGRAAHRRLIVPPCSWSRPAPQRVDANA